MSKTAQLDRACKGWKGRHAAKKEASRAWRRDTRKAVREGGEAPTRRPTAGYHS